MQKFAASFCKKLYDNEVLDDDFLIKWHSKKLRLDKNCILFDRSAENAMRPLLAEFITWLSFADYDAEDDYGEEEPTAAEEEKKEEEVVETET